MDILSYAIGKKAGGGSSPTPPSLTDLTATENGTYNHSGFDGYDEVVVAVPAVEPDLVDLEVSANGIYTHSGHDGYDEVSVNVPNSYGASDEGKVVSSAALVSQTSTTKTQNGTYDTTLNNEVVVNVPSPSGNINITDMNSTDVTAYATAQVVDADLVADNIKKDVNILGITGTYEGAGREYNVFHYRNGAFSKQNGRSQQPDGNTWSCASLPIASSDFLPFVNSIEITGFTGLSSIPSGWRPGFELDLGTDISSARIDVTISQKFWDDLYASSKEEYKRISYFRCNQTSLNFPYTEYIGDSCFSGCTSLTSISIPSVIGIGKYAFQNCRNLTSILLPSTLTTIGNSAFSTTGLTSISIPSGVSSLPNYCFQNCTDLTSVTIPSGVSDIGSCAFQSTGLQSVIFDGTPTSINSNVFQNSTNLSDIYVPWSLGEVAGAPWSATNATIHYNCTE